MAATITITRNVNWKKFQEALSSAAYARESRRVMRSAIGQAAHYVQKEMRQRISPGRRYEKNAALTLAIKGGKTAPLVDTARGIWQAIAIDIQDWNKAFVGVKFTSGAHNLAKTLHDGAAIKVTAKMRAMFYYLYLRSQGRQVSLTGRAAELWERYQGPWSPIGDTTDAIRIPPRPFAREPMEDPAISRAVRDMWQQAMTFVFKRLMGTA